MADNLRKFTTQEVLNKVYSDSSGNSIGINAATSKETLNAALDTSNSRLNVSLAGGTISGDVTINGDLTVNGDGAGAYDEIVNGQLVTFRDDTSTVGTNDNIVIENDGSGDASLKFSLTGATDWFTYIDNSDSDKFKIRRSTTDHFTIDESGNVGIGASPITTHSAVTQLTLGGNSLISSHTATGASGTLRIGQNSYLNSSGNTAYVSEDQASMYTQKDGTHKFQVVGSGTGVINTSFIDALLIDNSGNVGIGTSTPVDQGLTVANDGDVNLTLLADSDANGDNNWPIIDFRVDNTSGNPEARIYYKQDATSLILATSNTNALTLDSSQNATFAGKVAISSAFTNNELLGVKGSVGSDWGARIENTSSTGAGALIKSATTNAGVQLFQVRSGSDNVFTIMGDQNATFAGNVTVNGSTTTPMTISADTDKVFTLSSGIGETDNVPTIQTINTAGSALVGFGVRASVINLVTGSAKRLVLDDNSRISLSNNDSGGTGGSDSTSGNTLLGWRAGIDIASGGLNNTSIGHASGFKLTTGDANTYLGRYAGLGNLTGSSNTFIGSQSGLSDNGSSHSNNTGVGANSLLSITTGGNNTAIGYNSLDAGTDAHDNTAIGFASLGSAVSVGYAVAIGNEAMNNGNVTSDADGAVGIGYKALYALTSGAGNTSIGYQSSEDVNTGAYNTVMGYQAFSADTDGSANVVIGWKAGRNIHGSTQNVMIGYKAMANMDNNPGDNIANCVAIGYEAFLGSDNDSTGTTTATNGTVAIGHSSLKALTTGATNTAVGYLASTSITTGSNNISLGYQALDTVTTGSDNIAIGTNALGNITNSSQKTIAIGTSAGFNGETDEGVFIGYAAGSSGTSTSDTDGAVGIGKQSLVNITSGAGATAVGYQSLKAMTSGANNTAVGYEAGDALTVGAENVALGSNALGAEVEGVSNTAIGYDALKIANAGGSNGAGTTTANTALGTQAGNALTTGKFNTFLGAGTDASANSGENQTVVGFGATGAGDNSVVLGNSDVTAVLCASDGEAQVYASAIRFPATQVGNSNDNALDDYEEGLYTPSITGSSSGNFVLNASFDRTSYTKIGRQVTYTGEIRIASDNSTSGEIRFSLPFDSADLTDTAGKSVSTSVYLSGHGDANIDSNKLLIYIEENSSFFRIAHVADDDTFAYLTHANVDGAWNLAFTLTYFTS